MIKQEVEDHPWAHHVQHYNVGDLVSIKKRTYLPVNVTFSSFAIVSCRKPTYCRMIIEARTFAIYLGLEEVTYTYNDYYNAYREIKKCRIPIFLLNGITCIIEPHLVVRKQ